MRCLEELIDLSSARHSNLRTQARDGKRCRMIRKAARSGRVQTFAECDAKRRAKNITRGRRIDGVDAWRGKERRLGTGHAHAPLAAQFDDDA